MPTDGSTAVTPGLLKTIAERLRAQYGAQKIIVFGSAARGQMTEHSDIDLLIVAATTERFYQRMASVHRTVRSLTRGLPLSPLVLTPEELQDRLDRGDQFIQDVLATGVEL